MKRRELLVAAPTLVAVGGVRAGAGPAGPGELVRWPASVSLLDGQAWRPLPGQAQIVVLWSTRCPFCRRHNVHVEKLHRALAGRPAAVLGVAQDRDPALVQRYAAQQGYSFPVTLAWPAMTAALSTRRMIPLTITVDRTGRLRQVIPGEMTEADVLELAALAA